MTERNEACPCGSGKKFKRCCALGAPRLTIGEALLGTALLPSTRALYVEDLVRNQPERMTNIDFVGCCHPSAPSRIAAANGPAAADGPAMEVSCTTCSRAIIVLATEWPLLGVLICACCDGAGPRVRFARHGAYAEIKCRACERLLDRVRLRCKDPAAAPVRRTILAIVHRGARPRVGRLLDIVQTLGPDELRVTDDLNAAVLSRAAWVAQGSVGLPPVWGDRTGLLALVYPRLGSELDERAREFLVLGSMELADGANEAEAAGLPRTAEAHRRLIEARTLQGQGQKGHHARN